ncbi:MAG TPA: hypothetical protein VGX78_04775 [Pirellulales bacterium]|nr:hypothetical protein [Pirellulales bacterium]
MTTAVVTPHLNHDSNENVSQLDLTLSISEPNVVAYLAAFPALETREVKAIEALKVGVIAIQSASPTLDVRVVHDEFNDLECRMREFLREFTGEVGDHLAEYFHDGDGLVPKKIDGLFGEGGAVGRTFHTYFDPAEGRLARVMRDQIGPQSLFGRALDAKNKDGILSVIEGRVQELVESKLDTVLAEFSLDHDESAMSKLKGLLTDHFQKLNQSLGIQDATAAEAQRGHVKGIEFEKDLYDVFAAAGRELGDDTELVRGQIGDVPRSKKGDFVAVLGETTGAPGQRIVVEVKDQTFKLKDAGDELQEAKKNRSAAIGIFVYARGCEPAEVGDFRRIGDDFYCTVDKDDLREGRPLLFFDSAYRIARALSVAAVRKESSEGLDLDAVEGHLTALATWSERIADMATKARTIQNSGKFIEECAARLKDDLDSRVALVQEMLR